MERIITCFLLVAVCVSLFQNSSLSSTNFSIFNWGELVSRHKGRDNPESKFYLGISYANLGKIVEASEVLKGIIGEDYDYIDRHIYRMSRDKLENGFIDVLCLNTVAFCEYAFGRYTEALSVFELLSKVDRDNLWVRIYLALCYSKADKIDKAIAEVKYVLSKEPKNQYAHFLLGLAYEERGEYGKMMLEFMKAPGVVRQMIDFW